MIANGLISIITAAWYLLLEMSPYLLFGFLAAGILNVLIPREKIYKHLAGSNLKSILKASIFGVPLPICSCGVIPIAAYLREKGAGKGSTVSFLSSTPTSGVDSVLATYSLLGPLFAVIRPVAALFAGILSGILTNISEGSHKNEISPHPNGSSCNTCSADMVHSRGFIAKIKSIFNYAFIVLIGDVGKWIVVGVLIGSIIGFLIPGNIVEKYLGTPILAYPLMLLISIPMYICATGSIPIAASLILKGMTPGAGLVFLIAGPATNAATLLFTGGKLGKKTLFMYLISIMTTALLFGLLLDSIWALSGKSFSLLTGSMQMLPHWLKTVSAVLLSGLMINAFIQKTNLFSKISKFNEPGDVTVYKIPDMTCNQCVATIRKALRDIPGIKYLEISLSEKLIKIGGEFEEKDLVRAIESAGFAVEKK